MPILPVDMQVNIAQQALLSQMEQTESVNKLTQEDRKNRQIVEEAAEDETKVLETEETENLIIDEKEKREKNKHGKKGKTKVQKPAKPNENQDEEEDRVKEEDKGNFIDVVG